MAVRAAQVSVEKAEAALRRAHRAGSEDALFALRTAGRAIESAIRAQVGALRRGGIFIAGATGAVGKRLVPLLGANGHKVVGTTRSAGKVRDLRALGAEPVVLDVLDAEAVGRAVSEARPDVVVHQATALPDLTNLRNLDEAFAETNRLRTVGTDKLLAAAKAVGARKFVAQSFAGWPYASNVLLNVVRSGTYAREH
jgi:FlaA1/EpsC-like NDP-sugar epimerase